MSDLKNANTVQDVKKTITNQQKTTDCHVETKQQSADNNRRFQDMSRNLSLCGPQQETSRIKNLSKIATGKGHVDLNRKDTALKKQIGEERKLASDITGQAKDTRKDAQCLRQTGNDLDSGAMRQTVSKESEHLSRIAGELSDLARQASGHLKEVAAKDRNVDTDIEFPGPDKHLTDASGKEWGRMTKLNRSGSIHISQTNKSSLAGKGAHITTQTGGEGYHDYYDKNGNYKGSDY